MIEILSGGRGIGKTQKTLEFVVKKYNEANAENKRLKEAIKKAREELEAIAIEADFADYNNLSCGEEMSTETAKCEAEDICMGVKLDDVRAIFDKYLAESEDKK